MIGFWFDERLVPYLLVISKLCISVSFITCFLVLIQLNPTILASTIFGLCNVIARLTTMMAPMVAEMSYPTPLCITIALLMVATMASQLIITKQPKFV